MVPTAKASQTPKLTSAQQSRDHHAQEKINREIWRGANTQYLQRLLCRKWESNHQPKEQPT